MTMYMKSILTVDALLTTALTFTNTFFVISYILWNFNLCYDFSTHIIIMVLHNILVIIYFSCVNLLSNSGVFQNRKINIFILNPELKAQYLENQKHVY